MEEKEKQKLKKQKQTRTDYINNTRRGKGMNSGMISTWKEWKKGKRSRRRREREGTASGEGTQTAH